MKVAAMFSGKAISFSIRLALAAGLGCGTAAYAEDQADYLKISLDHARILKLDRSVSKVIIGTDQIADATVADPRTIVLTGKGFGTTNLVLLDSDGNAIVDERIIVALDEAKTIRVYRQTDRAIMSCAPNCESKTIGGSTTAAPAGG